MNISASSRGESDAAREKCTGERVIDRSFDASDELQKGLVLRKYSYVLCEIRFWIKVKRAEVN